MTTYLDRALQAAESARRMYAEGDHNGASNRAYYAVYYASCGLLERVGEANPGKTHASLLRKRFVLAGEAPAGVGRALTVAQNLRSKADYFLPGVTGEDAADAIAAVEKILEFAEPLLRRGAEAKAT